MPGTESVAEAPAPPAEPAVDWTAELARVRKEGEEALKAMQGERDDAKDEVAQVRHALETQLQSKTSRDREQKAELMRRQIARRMLNSRLTRGWSAWRDLATKRSYALRRLRQVRAIAIDCY